MYRIFGHHQIHIYIESSDIIATLRNFPAAKTDDVNSTKATEAGIKEEEPRPSPRKTKAPLASSGKSKSKGLRLNNNGLSKLDTFVAALESCFDQPTELGWIDLSMNDFTEIPDTLLEFENLKILNLHGNQISDITQVEKLARLKHLRKLSLHGNPVDKQKGYRSTVLSYLPNLLELDFSGVTKADRKTSNTLNSFNKNKRTKKKQDMDDED